MERRPRHGGIRGGVGGGRIVETQSRPVYRGEVGNWRDVGGSDLPVRLVSRNPGSGSRTAFQRRILGGAREAGTNSDDCRALDPGAPAGVVRCAEYAYTFGQPAAGSLAASFLRYLTNQVGADVIRSYGSRPCADLDNPALCRPA